jgi:Flp pilus assembly protein TadB
MPNKDNFEENVKKRKEKEKKEKQEQLKRQKEKDKKKKDRLEKLKRREAKENKKIRKIVDFPFRVLFQLSAISGLVALLIQYFGQGRDIIKALLNAFLAFTGVYLGAGLIMLAFTFVVSEQKKKESEEQKKQQDELKKAEELKRKEELAKIEEDMRLGELRRKEELRRFRENTINAAANNQPATNDEEAVADYMTDNEDDYL